MLFHSLDRPHRLVDRATLTALIDFCLKLSKADRLINRAHSTELDCVVNRFEIIDVIHRLFPQFGAPILLF